MSILPLPAFPYKSVQYSEQLLFLLASFLCQSLCLPGIPAWRLASFWIVWPESVIHPLVSLVATTAASQDTTGLSAWACEEGPAGCSGSAGICFHDCRPLSLLAISTHLFTLCPCYQPGLERLQYPNPYDSQGLLLGVGCASSKSPSLAEILPLRESDFFTSLLRCHQHLRRSTWRHQGKMVENKEKGKMLLTCAF